MKNIVPKNSKTSNVVLGHIVHISIYYTKRAYLEIQMKVRNDMFRHIYIDI